FSSRRRHTRFSRDWSSDVCSSDLGAFQWIAGLEYAHVNLVVAVFIWVMIYPMMIQIDFASIRDVSLRPQGLFLTLVINWLIKPRSEERRVRKVWCSQ